MTLSKTQHLREEEEGMNAKEAREITEKVKGLPSEVKSFFAGKAYGYLECHEKAQVLVDFFKDHSSKNTRIMADILKLENHHPSIENTLRKLANDMEQVLAQWEKES